MKTIACPLTALPNSICEGPTKEAALAALVNFRKENGYGAHRFKLQKEVEVVDIRVDHGDADPDEVRDLQQWLQQLRNACMMPRNQDDAAQ